jgi:hypothetical protein
VFICSLVCYLLAPAAASLYLSTSLVASINSHSPFFSTLLSSFARAPFAFLLAITPAIALSEDHKPYNPGEHERIDKAGGYVSMKRVDGDLAVSRALGDFQYKNREDLPPQQQKVTAHPGKEI